MNPEKSHEDEEREQDVIVTLMSTRTEGEIRQQAATEAANELGLEVSVEPNDKYADETSVTFKSSTEEEREKFTNRYTEIVKEKRG